MMPTLSRIENYGAVWLVIADIVAFNTYIREGRIRSDRRSFALYAHRQSCFEEFGGKSTPE